MAIDKLKLNDGKTELMLIDTRQQLAKVNVLSGLRISDSIITPTAVTKHLGTPFDANMT